VRVDTYFSPIKKFNEVRHEINGMAEGFLEAFPSEERISNPRYDGSRYERVSLHADPGYVESRSSRSLVRSKLEISMVAMQITANLESSHLSDSRRRISNEVAPFQLDDSAWLAERLGTSRSS
jgi:hypothetical protein